MASHFTSVKELYPLWQASHTRGCLSLHLLLLHNKHACIQRSSNINEPALPKMKREKPQTKVTFATIKKKEALSEDTLILPKNSHDFFFLLHFNLCTKMEGSLPSRRAVTMSHACGISRLRGAEARSCGRPGELGTEVAAGGSQSRSH